MFGKIIHISIFLFCFSVACAGEKTPHSNYMDSLYEIENILIGGQPKKSDFSVLKEMNIKSIINLRTEKEMNGLSFDEEYLVKQSGIQYQQVAIERNDLGYTPENLAAFAQAIDNSGDGLILLHCRTGKRVKQLYMAYLVKYKNKTAMQALEMVQPDGWPLPLQQLLDSPLTLTIDKND